jgi:hypothetical protein
MEVGVAPILSMSLMILMMLSAWSSVTIAKCLG